MELIKERHLNQDTLNDENKTNGKLVKKKFVVEQLSETFVGLPTKQSQRKTPKCKILNTVLKVKI